MLFRSGLHGPQGRELHGVTEFAGACVRDEDVRRDLMLTMEPDTPFVFLPGSGNQAPDLNLLRSGPLDNLHFETIHYPDWRSYGKGAFKPEALIDELAAKILKIVPEGPIRIAGLSIGGHFGYAAALQLLRRGHTIACFCAIDSFMFDTAAATAGWQGRALSEALQMVRSRRAGDLLEFARSRSWRLMLRLSGGRLPGLIRGLSSIGLGSRIPIDPVLEQELGIRFMARETAPWLASLDSTPAPLDVPAFLLRTRSTAGDDPAWRRRCPSLKVIEIDGTHHSLFSAENAGKLREAFGEVRRCGECRTAEATWR